MGPVVLVTGAGGWLGAAISVALARGGARLVAHDLERDRLAALRDALSNDAALLEIQGDITSPAEASALVSRAVAELGQLDVLVNAAGVEGPIGPSDEVDIAEFRHVFEVNVFALFALSAAAVRHFRPRRSGRIVNLASGAGLGGTALMAAYSASKHAVVGLTRSMAREVAADGIAVNAVCPGCVDSPMMSRIEQRLGEAGGTGPVSFLDGIPSGRYCDPAEVAETVSWLALEASPYMTGSAIVIDGGLRA